VKDSLSEVPHAVDSVVSAISPAQPATYADLIISYLAQINVEYLFGVPGGAIEPLYNALARHMRQPAESAGRYLNGTSLVPVRQRGSWSHIKPVIARHESGAAFMADGYARETGRLGVCCATTGPGATNLITGVASAYADRIPMLVITPQTALPNFGKRGLQESSSDAVDVVGMFEHCTKYNSLVSHPEQLEGKLFSALLNAFRRPRGPVHLSIPMDILNAPVKGETGGYQVAHLFRQPRSLDEEAYHAMRTALAQAKKPVLFLGAGSRHAVDIITSYAELTNTPIVTTPAGKGWVNPYHPLYRGVFGFAGHPSAYATLDDEEADLILAVGTAMGELSTSGWNTHLMSSKLVHISASPEDFARTPMACLHLSGDIRTIFAKVYTDFLINNSEHKKVMCPMPRQELRLEGEAYLPRHVQVFEPDALSSAVSPLKPQRVMSELAKRFPKKTRFVVDAGNAWAWATHYLFLDSVGVQRTGFGFGAMGWAIGAAVGTSFGTNKSPVVCITGDGSYLMNGQELTVAVAEQLPVIFVVLNDQALGMVKHGQRLNGAEAIGYELPVIDFAMVARGMGAQGYTIRSVEDFERLDMAQICSANGPTLLDIHIDGEAIPPMGARVEVLKKQQGLTNKRL
jgi:acetolactate synthase-1/2/3 large subunit